MIRITKSRYWLKWAAGGDRPLVFLVFYNGILIGE